MELISRVSRVMPFAIGWSSCFLERERAAGALPNARFPRKDMTNFCVVRARYLAWFLVYLAYYLIDKVYRPPALFLFVVCVLGGRQEEVFFLNDSISISCTVSVPVYIHYGRREGVHPSFRTNSLSLGHSFGVSNETWQGGASHSSL